MLPEAGRAARVSASSDSPIAPASVSMCAASERSASECAASPATTSTAMKPTISASAIPSRRRFASGETPWPCASMLKVKPEPWTSRAAPAVVAAMDRRALVIASASLVLAPRAFGQSLAGTEVALVTADLEARLVAVELATGRVLRRVPTLPKPRSIETVGHTAVLAHSEIGAVSLVHAPTLRVAHVLRGFREPRYTAAHPDGRRAYGSDAKRGAVVSLDVIGGRVLAGSGGGALSRHITIDPTGRTLWVSLGSKAREVAVVDVSRRIRPR